MQSIVLACPLCHGPLQQETQAYICSSDRKSYPVTCGIPDFRVFHGETIKADFEQSSVACLLSEYTRRSFKELIELDPTLDPALPSGLLARRRLHILGGVTRARRWLGDIGRLCDASPRGRFLELGCGTGGFLVAAADVFELAVGLDINLSRLILAKKQLEETGRQAILIAANAQFLPFQGESFHMVVGSDVIEHVETPSQVMQEAYRVLQSGGAIFLATPNRWSLTPEPHVNVWGVGWLPRAWREPYVRLIRKLPYRNICLLNWFELRRLLAQTHFHRWRIFLPTFPSEHTARLPWWARVAVPLYHALKDYAVTKWLIYLFGPVFHVVCVKK